MMRSMAQKLREQADERSALIAVLGWATEIHTVADRYAATTGELRRWVHEYGVDWLVPPYNPG